MAREVVRGSRWRSAAGCPTVAGEKASAAEHIASSSAARRGRARRGMARRGRRKDVFRFYFFISRLYLDELHNLILSGAGDTAGASVQFRI